MTNVSTLADATDAKSHFEQRPLDAFFKPRVVAVIGATETPGSVGRTVLQNLIATPFGGTIFPVNPKRASVLGIKAYPTIASVPDRVDLAIIITPAPTVPGIVHECVEAGVQAAVILSAGFKECGEPGADLERQVLAEAMRGRLRIIGPNCLGLMNPHTGLNATFARTLARPGSVGFISQSGALCTAVLDWSLREEVGFSAFVSIGSMLDIGWGDLIDYLGEDPNTHSILIYMESVGAARAFLSAAREVALTKPIIVLKAGRTDVGSKAAASHTGALTGSDEVLDAAFHRCGALRVNTIAELFNMAEILASQPRPKGPRLAILTNAGGAGVLAADALIADGGKLADLSPQTVEALNQTLPVAWSRNNPIDILGDATPERYAQALEVAAKDPNTDGLLVILTPQAMTDPTQTAEMLKPYARLRGKPLLASWMGGVEVAAGQAILHRAGIPTYFYPDTAARMFHYMWRYSDNLRSLYETPAFATEPGEADSGRVQAERIIETVRQSGRTLLTEYEAKQVLAAYGIPTVETRIAGSEEAAVRSAEEIGYPVVLKLSSKTITHKTDVGGVKLNLVDADAVRNAYREIESAVIARVGKAHFEGVTVQPMIRADGYELIVGSSVDPQFGPVLLFGMGGQLVEVFGDRALALPPLTTTLARRMMERTRIFEALKGVRGRNPVDLEALDQLLVRFSRLVVEQRWIKEVDINPLLASPDRLLALDARIVTYGPEVDETYLPRPAVRPYPAQYVDTWTMRDGTEITLRPILAEDEPLMAAFHATLSDRSIYLRYWHAIKPSQFAAHERLVRMCFIDYDREIALVAERKDPSTGEREILGIGHLLKVNGGKKAEFALLISDPYQDRGIGTELLSRLLQVGRDEKLERITGEILSENVAMQRICERLGFRLHEPKLGEGVTAEIVLKQGVGCRG